jgi:hypothetical protein
MAIMAWPETLVRQNQTVEAWPPNWMVATDEDVGTLEIDWESRKSRREWFDLVWHKAAPIIDEAAAKSAADMITGTGYSPAVETALVTLGLEAGTKEYQAARRSMIVRLKNRAARELMVEAEAGKDTWGLVYQERLRELDKLGVHGRNKWKAAYQVLTEKGSVHRYISQTLSEVNGSPPDPIMFDSLVQEVGLAYYDELREQEIRPAYYGEKYALNRLTRMRLAVIGSLFGLVSVAGVLIPELTRWLQFRNETEAMTLAPGLLAMGFLEWWRQREEVGGE